MRKADRKRFAEKIRALSDAADDLAEEIAAKLTEKDEGTAPGCAWEDLGIARGHLEEAAAQMEPWE